MLDRPKKLSGLEKTRYEIKKLMTESAALTAGGPADPIEWIEDNTYDWTTVSNFKGVYDYSAAKKIILCDYQKDILRHVLGFDDKGRLPYSTVIWSQPKKHGKTQIAGAVGAWFSANVEPPNMIFTLASNQEQSAGLIFNALVPTLYSIGGKVPNTSLSTPIIQLPNGTVVRAIPNNYAGQAGGNYGLTLWSELWTYKSERDRRLWEEMPPVPTRHNSMRWVETYAGFENESDLLLSQFLRIFRNTAETETQPNARPVPELEHIVTTHGRPACWHIPEEGLFYFHDHEIRAPWITDEYLRNEKAENRHATFVRLWQNRWQTSTGTFIEPHLWDDATTIEDESWGPMVLAGDASQRNDHTALVGVQKRIVKMFGKDQERYRVMRVRVWDPQGKDIDLDETIASEVEKIFKAGLLIGAFRYDPFQMHQVAVNLRKRGVPCKEFTQGTERLYADTFLWKLFNEGRIDVYPSTILEAHVKGANVKEYENEQVRIIKGEASTPQKVDAAVALSMACWAASQRKVTSQAKKRTSMSFSMLDAGKYR